MCDIPVVAHLILYKSGVPDSLWFFPLPGKSATVENERDCSMCSTECVCVLTYRNVHQNFLISMKSDTG